MFQSIGIFLYIVQSNANSILKLEEMGQFCRKFVGSFFFFGRGGGVVGGYTMLFLSGGTGLISAIFFWEGGGQSGLMLCMCVEEGGRLTKEENKISRF